MVAFARAFLTAAAVLSLAACAGPEKPLAKYTPPTAGPAGSPEEAWARLAELPWPQEGQRTYQNYDEARRIFWRKLYPAGGTELYCGIPFDGTRRNEAGEALSIEHSFPADAIAESEPGCTDRTCSATRVARAMADLQNLWPAFQRVNSSRARLRYGEITGEGSRRFTEICPDFERTSGAKAVVEPRDDVKGDVARSLVYMHFVYGLALEDAVADKGLLLNWMQADPPDAEEMRRNALIDQLQGTPNPLLQEAFIGL
jgi:deoxyribonuclease-1